MTFDPADLAAEFPRAAVHWRVQGKPYERNGKFAAMALAYIDARDVMDRLDQVCGPANWQDSYTETPSGRVVCTLSIRIGDDWVAKSDGAGGTQVEAEKGGLSDALKRAAVKWGIGRYLYRLDSPWVACDVNQKNGNTYWKRWAEDPWSKVKVVGYQQPETPKVDAASEGQWFRATLPDLTTADEINALLPRAKKAGRDVSKLVADRANELGLDFDPQARRYFASEAA